MQTLAELCMNSIIKFRTNYDNFSKWLKRQEIPECLKEDFKDYFIMEKFMDPELLEDIFSSRLECWRRFIKSFPSTGDNVYKREHISICKTPGKPALLLLCSDVCIKEIGLYFDEKDIIFMISRGIGVSNKKDTGTVEEWDYWPPFGIKDHNIIENVCYMFINKKGNFKPLEENFKEFLAVNSFIAFSPYENFLWIRL